MIDMKNFGGIFKTIEDGFIQKWSVGFRALSWEDAESIAEGLGVSEVGEILGTFNRETGEFKEAVSHFCSWHYRNGQFVDEQGIL